MVYRHAALRPVAAFWSVVFCLADRAVRPESENEGALHRTSQPRRDLRRHPQTEGEKAGQGGGPLLGTSLYK